MKSTTPSVRTGGETVEPAGSATLKGLLKRLPPLVAAVRSARRFAFRCGQTWGKTRWVNESKIRAYLGAHSLRKLHVGAGPHHLPGWLNTDFEYVSADTAFLDATRPFPFGEGTFDYLFSEHMIEHIAYAQGVFMLGECHRVLKPGGRIRIATPNLKKLVELFDGAPSNTQRRYMEWALAPSGAKVTPASACFVLNGFVRDWGHQFIYDPPALQDALEQAGFAEVTPEQPGESADENLRDLESHGRQIGEEWNRFETMVLEARRPPV